MQGVHIGLQGGVRGGARGGLGRRGGLNGGGARVVAGNVGSVRVGARGDARAQLRIRDGAGGRLVGDGLHDGKVGRLEGGFGAVHEGLQGSRGGGLLLQRRFNRGVVGGTQCGSVVGNLLQLVEIHAGAVQQRVEALLLNANHIINVELVGDVVVVDGGGRRHGGIAEVEAILVDGGGWP